MKRIIWRNRASAILGFFVVIVPFLGFYESVRTFLLVLLGLAIIILGLVRSGGHYQGKALSSEIKKDQIDDLPELSSSKESAEPEK